MRVLPSDEIGTPPPPDGDDAALVAAARAGDRGALSRLLERHQDRLFSVCLRMCTGPASRSDAADLTQEAMLRIVQGLPQFDSRSTFGTWSVRIAMNVCLSHLRAAKLRRHVSLDAAPSIAPSAPEHDDRTRTRADSASFEGESSGVEGELSASSRVQSVGDALAHLDDDHRSVLVLRDVRGLDYDQIAYVLSLNPGTAKSRLFRARAALRALLERPA